MGKITLCGACGKPFQPKRDAKTCSVACRQRLARGQVGVMHIVPPPDRDTSTAVRKQLESAGRTDTYLGQSALALAHLIDNATAVMGFAALVKELRVTMDAAMAGATTVEDPLDMVRARRDAKRNAG